MNLNEFKETVKNSSKFHIENRSDQISVDSFLMPSAYKEPNYFRKIAVSVMSLFVVFIFSFYMYLNLTPVSTLTIDINPSILVELNRFNKVVNITGADAEGIDFANDLSVKNSNLDDLLEAIYSKGIEEGYFTSTNASALIGVYAKDYETEYLINQLVTNVPSINVLAINQHLENDDLRINSNYTFTYETITEGATSDLNEYPGVEDGLDFPVYNYGIGNITEEELGDLIDEYGLSYTQLEVILYIFQNSTDYTSYDDFIILVNLDISTLIDLYNSIH